MSEAIKFWKGDSIESMTGNNIYVYGANPEFRNGYGDAKTARKFGAKPFGSGRGIVGNTYGIVTKNLKPGYFEKETGITYPLSGEKSLSKEMIVSNIKEFYDCALSNPDKTFFVSYTNKKRNLNGYSSFDIWNMFTRELTVPENVRFHNSFRSFYSI